MGVECSCLQHRRRYPRRPSDDPTALEMDEFDLLMQSPASSTDDDDLLARGDDRVVKRSSKSVNDSPVLPAYDPSTASSSGSTTTGGLLESIGIHMPNSSATIVERNLEALHSYQIATGVIDEGQAELECIMCLDTFSPENPKVRSLCNCGMNRTNFHLSCLMEWLNRNSNCPVCRTYLFFEDS